jgi:hypothetical protein
MSEERLAQIEAALAGLATKADLEGLATKADLSKASLGETIRSWITTIGIIVAAIWAAYTFVYKEIVVPQSAPINVSVNLSIQEAGGGNFQNAQQFSAVLVEISATNPSSRTIYLLPSVWRVYGRKATIKNDRDTFTKSVTNAIQSEEENYTEKYTTYSPSELIAAGRPFSDTGLRPSENVKRSFIIHFPQNTYDALEIIVDIPTVAEDKTADLKWKLSSDGNDFVPTMYRIGPDGSRREMERDKDGGYSDALLGLQTVHARSQLSLWH